MNFIDIIEKKKQKQALNHEEIQYFVSGAANKSIPDYQLSALLMAIRLNGMNREETAQFTMAMTHSGDVVDLSGIDGIPTDKHSTGGVGDTTTLVLVPLVAACGVKVAKMSGRGLGHTGGTLDKMESIEGMRVERSIDEFIKQVQEIGCAVVGQSGNLAPADKTLYALRDVTATVDSMPLIAASIMSKKLASGAKSIILDVKTGSGALMNTLEESIALAQAMVHIGTDAGRNVVALITDMNEPLGSHVGNALEVKEAVDVLSGRVKGTLLSVALSLGTQMMLLGGGANSAEEAKEKLLKALESGEGLKKLAQLIEAQGGDSSCVYDTTKLPEANVVRDVVSLETGYIGSMNTISLGNAAQKMGAGRKTKTDVIDYSVGFVLHKRIGDEVEKGEVLATVYAKDEQTAVEAIESMQTNINITKEKPPATKMIHAYVDNNTVVRY